MTIVCQKCGVKGFEELLVYCNKCQASVEHRYCLDRIPKTKEPVVHWLCEKCDIKVPKVDTLRKGNTKRKQWDMRPRHHRSRCADLHKQMKYCYVQSTFNASTSLDVDKPLNGTLHSLEIDVLNIPMISEKSISVNIEQPDLLLPTEENGVLPERENCEPLGNDIDCRKIKKKRKLILNDDSDEDDPSLVPVTDGVPCRGTTQLNRPFTHFLSPQSLGCSSAQQDKSSIDSADECYSYFPVSPVVHPVWRGYINICSENYCPVVAHLSNIACEKVHNVAGMLPEVLHFERLPRLEAWPKRFESSAPTDDDIALYFFAGDVRAKAVLEQLLGDLIEKDLVLKVTVDKAELLVFSSSLLPLQYQSFEGEHFLWGVFKGQVSRLLTPPDSHCPRSSEAAGLAYEHQDCDAFEDASKASGCQVADKYLFRFSEVEEKPARGDEDTHLRRESANLCLSPGVSTSFVEGVDEVVLKNFDSNVEFNFRGEYEGDVDGSLAACLELFPLEIEDLGITRKVPGCDEVDLELGLETVMGRNREHKPIVEEHMVLLFGRTIC